MTIERNRYITTAFDNDKASLGFSEEEFQTIQTEIERIHRQIQLGEREVTDARRAFVYILEKDFSLAESNGAPYELWMEYHILEELYHLVGRVGAGIQGEFQDAMREFEHLREEV